MKIILVLYTICSFRYHFLTGVPFIQNSISFEKSSVLFNIGCLYSQIGARQSKIREEGLDRAVDNFLRAAGIFLFIKDNFNNAGEDDVGANSLTMLESLMVCQARECLLQKSVLEGEDDLDVCQEAAYVSSVYSELLSLSLPFSWQCYLQVKQKHYQALSDYYTARGMTRQGVPMTRDAIYSNTCQLPTTNSQRKYLGKTDMTYLC